MLSDGAIKELQDELLELYQLQVRVAERITAIDAVLTPLDLGESNHLRGVVGAGSIEAQGQVFAPVVTPTIELPVRQPKRYADMGLRAAVLDALHQHGPKRSPEIAKILSEAGFENEGKTPLPTRVYNDLWRLSAKGKVTNDDGVFAVK